MRTWRSPTVLSLALFVIFAFFFRAIISDPSVISDLNNHIGFAKSAYQGDGTWPRHILYFALVALTSFWSDSLEIWQISGWLWLSLFVVAKFLAAIWFGHLWISASTSRRPFVIDRPLATDRAILLIALGLTIVFCFPQPTAFSRGLWYAYSFPPNTWHNSTQIAVMPFAIVVFGLSVLQLEQPGNLRGAVAIAALAVLSALAKPSFLMAWSPAYGICTLIVWWKGRSFRDFLISASPIAAAVMIVLLQYYFIYVENINNSVVKLGYLDAWTSRVDRTAIHFYISIFFSSFFPIVFYATHPKRIMRLPHILSVGMVVVSYVYAMALSEAGDSIQAGNFMWSIISANFISYMICIFDLFAMHRNEKLIVSRSLVLRFGLPAVLFGLNSLWGLAYMIRYVLGGQFA